MINALRRHGLKTAAAVVGLELTTKIPSEGRTSKYYHKATDQFVVPAMRKFLSAESAHDLAIFCTKNGLAPKFRIVDKSLTDMPTLSTNVLGLSFPNCIGLAAGFDKDAVAISGLFDIGFGFLEIGSVTPLPQPGNPKPRMFRAVEDRGVINRYGFNSVGADEVEQNLIRFRACNSSDGILGVNLGKNKLSKDEVPDYKKGIQKLGPYADFVVINISSPNTPGLRDLQKREPLRRLLRSAVEERNRLEESHQKKPPIFVKIAPDLTKNELKDIAEIVQECSIDGVVISNTTCTRPIESKVKDESGGLSGAPLRSLSTECIRTFYSLTNGKVPIIGVGGVGCGLDALEKLKAGASVVQVYSMLVYEGPGMVSRIRHELSDLLKKEGFERVDDVVGLDHADIYKTREKVHI